MIHLLKIIIIYIMNIIYKHISFSVTSLRTEQLYILTEATIVKKLNVYQFYI